jgi:hypothetical protein
MLVVLIVNVLISLVCWTVAVKLLCCRPHIQMVTKELEKATVSCAQLQITPLILAKQQLQLLQFRQTYQVQTGQVDQIWQLLQLIKWLRRAI